MEFRTAIKPLDNGGFIAHEGKIVMFGSCFTDNIGTKLRNAMFDVELNPFGTTFNPQSISSCIEMILAQQLIGEEELFQYNGLWRHFCFHSRFAGVDKGAVLNMMNEQVLEAYKSISMAQKLIITFGTAYIYKLSATNMVVNNCHKLPASNFTRVRLNVSEIVSIYNDIITRILEVNPNIKIVFTVSPIRHIADGIAENSLSKSVLRVAVDEIVNLYPTVCSYFPAYEIMLDDLRDYRFYAADMVHPSDVAIEYIWQMFQQSYFTNQLIDLVNRCTKLSKRFTHRHISDNLLLKEKFNDDTLRAMNELVAEYPYLQNVVGIAPNNNPALS